MMKKKYEFSVRMQQRHLKAIVGATAEALPWGRGIGSASAAFRTRERAWGASATFRTREWAWGASAARRKPKWALGELEVKDGERKEGDSPVSAVLRV